MRQWPETKPRYDQGHSRRCDRLPYGTEGVSLQHTQEADIHSIPEGSPEELIRNDLWCGDPPEIQDKRTNDLRQLPQSGGYSGRENVFTVCSRSS